MSSVNEFKIIVYTSVVTASISFLCSGFLLLCIFFLSKLKWRSPVRRIIIGFCIYDMIFSLGNAFSGFAVPEGKGLLAFGNQMTCDIQGYMLQMGIAGSALYNTTLAIYYVAIIAFSMKKDDFKRKIEWWMHLFTIVFSVGSATFLLVGKYFNAIRYGNMCHISASPIQCLLDKNVECERGSEKAVLYTMLFLIYPFFLSFITVFISMMVIIRTVMLNKINSERWRMADSSTVNRNLLLRCVFAICRLTSISLIRKRLQSLSGSNQDKTMTIKKQSLSVPSGGDAYTTQGIEVNSSDKRVSGFCSNLSEDLRETNLETSVARSSTSVEEPNLNDRVRNHTKRSSLETSLAGNIPDETENVRPSAVSRSGTADDPYAFDIRKVVAQIQKETNSRVNSKNSTGGKTVECPFSSFKTDTVSTHSTNEKGRITVDRDHNFTVARNNAPTSHEKKDSFSVEDQAAMQALLYMASFLFCYIFVACSTIVEVRKAKIPFGLRVLNRLTTPLQGLFFILVYLRPRINRIRKDDETITYFKALIISVKSGGDNDRCDSASFMSNERRKRLQQCVYTSYRRRRKLPNEKALIMKIQKVGECFEESEDEEISCEIEEMNTERDEIIPKI